MDRWGYINILAETMLPAVRPLRPDGNIVFMQDNAGIHTARDTMAFLHAEGVEVIYWPSHSPDLNPIEHVWAMMEKEWDNRNEATREALSAHILEAWQTFVNRPQMIRNMVESMPRRLAAVIAAN
ncbi:hypothetical protein FOCC_FOCC017805, partial [Frankliniella occidentalis]